MRLFVIFLSLVTIYFIGIWSGHTRSFPFPLLVDVKRMYNTNFRPDYVESMFVEVEGRTEVPCFSETSNDHAVILVIGQSNVTNSVKVLMSDIFEYPKRSKSVNTYFSGKCYPTEATMLGATGNNLSVWLYMGGLLIKEGIVKNITFTNVAVHGSRSSQWVKGSKHFKRTENVIKALRDKNLNITHVLWHQGESDSSSGISQMVYYRNIESLILGLRETGVDAPIFISQTSRCQSPENQNIRAAQRSLVTNLENTFAGPDSDKIVTIDARYDACHFSEIGMKEFGDMWVQSIKDYQVY